MYKAGVNYNGVTSFQSGLQVATTYWNPVALVLSGNLTVPASTSIVLVETWFAGCVADPSSAYSVFSGGTKPDSGHNADLAPKNCNWNSQWLNNTSGSSPEDLIPFTFTSTVVSDASGAATPLPVTAGQIVQITVTISFS
jgi:hypothetical protein